MTRPEVWKDCTVACERVVECAVCGHTKRPWGRSVPLAMENSRCGFDCPGYDKEPHPGHLWPGELAQMDEQAENDAPKGGGSE